MSRPVAISLRLYRALARAFPQEFKNAYGDELVQATEDAIEFIWRRHGVLGLLRLLLDIALRIPAEHVAELRQDIRYGLRTLARSPGFTAVALVSLTLGICIATCAYTEINGLLRDIPGVPKPGELVALQTPTSFPLYKRYRQLNDLFTSTFAYVAPVPFGVSLGGHTERTWGHLVTPSYMATLGVRPALGRALDEREEQSNAPPSVMISHRFWEANLGADASIVGKTLRINGNPCNVLGVAPKDFLGASPSFFVADLWIPVAAGAQLAPELAENAMERRDLTMFQVVGRLKPGVTEARAETELDAVTRQFEQSYGELKRDDKSRRVVLAMGGKILPLRKQDVPFFTQFLMVLGSLVLLIACSNVANMMLARAADRRKEIAVRLALGASRARLVRQFLTESMLIAVGAGIPAFAVSAWLMHMLSRQRMPLPMPVTYDLNPDARVLLFTLSVTVLTGFLFGIVPAIRATRTDLTPALKEGGNIRVRSYRRLSLRNLLVLGQMAASLTLLLLTGFLGLGIQTTLGVQQGFDPRNVYLVSLDPVRQGYSAGRATAFFERVLDRVKRLPSVTAASLTDTLPVAMDGSGGLIFSAPGRGNAKALRWARRFVVGRDYFDTTGIRILLGRAFRKQDEADAARTVIVSEALVREMWKGGDPVGRQIEVANGEISGYLGALPGSFDFRPGVLEKKRELFEVAGVASDVPEGLVVKKPGPAIYFPLRPAEYAQPSLRGVTLMVRAMPGVDVLRAVQREVSALDPDLTPFNGRTMNEQIAQFMAPLRTAAWTYGLIGVFGLVLAAVGVAGVTAYSVAQRGHEIGIRIALGAQSKNVLAVVMKEGTSLVVTGTVAGLILAWGGIRVLSGVFFTVTSIKTYDARLTVGAPLLLAGLALLACYVPARRSMRIDPIVALRQE